jgi:inhibitor of KinA sporulation pathway (predicted exonuclease)
MNYVVVDFEWNQNPYRKVPANRRMPFEIIEIGAVMLDENLKEIDRFSQTVRPKLYKKLHYKTKEITGITQRELDRSDPFKFVAVDFMLWCGDDYTFCTWGDTDLIELQRNLKYYGLLDLLPGPIRYYNLQKMFRYMYMPGTEAASLETATDFFHISKDKKFHRAVNDAAYTAEIFKHYDLEKADRLYTVDYYQNPKTRDEEIYLVYDDCSEFVSREFNTREELMADKEVRSTRCFLCGRAARKKLYWFTGRTKAHYCLAYCPEHGYISGNIKIKKTDDDKKCYAVKTLRLVDEAGAEHIRTMKKDIIDKRWDRRHRGTSRRQAGTESPQKKKE